MIGPRSCDVYLKVEVTFEVRVNAEIADLGILAPGVEEVLRARTYSLCSSSWRCFLWDVMQNEYRVVISDQFVYATSPFGIWRVIEL